MSLGYEASKARLSDESPSGSGAVSMAAMELSAR
jgi:hypothetical protein